MSSVENYVTRIKKALDLNYTGDIVEIDNLDEKIVDSLRENLGDNYKVSSTIHIKKSQEELSSENKYTIHIKKLRE